MSRPEDSVMCPACGHAPGNSCDGPTSHPSRRIAHVASRATIPENWINHLDTPPAVDSGGVINFTVDRDVRATDTLHIQYTVVTEEKP